ncbi:MAG: hypothetical protein HYU86_01020 [Chloroflexi bacterium]|nr:hypothetical protein [Chloroflexota bacterium]
MSWGTSARNLFRLFRRWRDIFQAGDETPEFMERTWNGHTVRLSDFRWQEGPHPPGVRT